ncbi:peptide/nickel transport system ATP-binding protein/oligopeptide transport system ATP-binding protein [Cohnella lupini]|uniref:Peptide/nickel transport system ATP-binding protein/oligopeptide transport system ATP-binding protein n=1 Tax=Cohnella lupini TaxID=1294267 RepID=A0A3D9IQ99_9BACL|nr:peptide/nickel transport system ATP-binding protein/oligopeptide transport system ATP-binding protein [Cohnella lupini]
MQIKQGMTLGLVGESGCGKTTLSKLLLGLEPATSGRVTFDGIDITGWSAGRMRPLRSRMQLVFQNSVATFDPLFTIERIVAEPLDNNGRLSVRERRRAVIEWLSLVDLDGQVLNRYPHELSGGQQQRVGIARALASRPELLVCDEPFSSQDFMHRKTMLQLLLRLKRQLNLTYLFITHDLSLVPELCDEVSVMHRGKVLETVKGDRIAADCNHPYTRELWNAVPALNPRDRKIRF